MEFYLTTKLNKKIWSNNLENVSTIHINNLSLLGDSIYQILNTLLRLYNKNITIFVNDKQIISLDFEDIEFIINFEKDNIKKRLSKTKKTLFIQSKKKTPTRIGRSNKSVFDKYKKLIFLKLNNNETQVSILKSIKIKNPTLNNLTPQALSQYIKRVKKETIERHPMTSRFN